MNRYQLAKLVYWAGTVKSRKRMQKVVYMLKRAGCPLEADFYLHHYGPYSDDVARLTDEMVRLNLLKERAEPGPMGEIFFYRLPESTAVRMQELEKTEPVATWQTQLAPFEATAKKLMKSDLKELEYASTILFFQQRTSSWPTAVEEAVKFKLTEDVRKALPLAQSVVDQ